MTEIRVLDYDIIYLSYDEPNAEKNFADLLTKVPWAKRVHGVKGSDAAHKACAELSETDRFITVDGDNIVHPKFFEQTIDFSMHPNLENSVISWCGRNVINGLTYGNGGLKCWPKDYVLKMRTHENADPNNVHAQVDFCWNTEYVQMNSCFSDVYNNSTPQQAWRAGFREGVKMALDQGVRPSKEEFYKLHWRCLHLLYVWTMIGADVENGLWAIYGAREGLWRTMCTDWDYVNVRDFEYLNDFWDAEVSLITEEQLSERVEDTGALLINELDLPIAEMPLDGAQSKFFKNIYTTPSRKPNQPIIIDPE